MRECTDQRRLAAIMFTDMVAYSALAQRNEALALELLQEHRQLLRGIFPRFNGTEIKTMGDAFLVEFHSALEATQCAVEVQRTLAERNKNVPPDRKIEVRIGIHTGDVVHREGDVLGDGVNIASRVAPMAEAGGIRLTQQVFDNIENKSDLQFVRTGQAELKNIQAPVDLYRVALPWVSSRERLPEPALARLRRMPAGVLGLVVLVCALVTGLVIWNGRHQVARKSGAEARGSLPAHPFDKCRLAVLPFANISPNTNDEYFADGMHDQLITTLSGISGLRVIARTSVMPYKSKQKSIAEIGRELQVGTILEGSVRRDNGKVRVTAQLIEVATEEHYWSNVYDDPQLTNAFAIQSEVAEKVAAALRVTLLPDEQRKVRKIPTTNWQAVQLYFKGRSLLNKRTPDDLRSSIQAFQEAVEMDSQFALAYTGKADAYALLCVYRELAPDDGFPKALSAAQQALKLDPSLGEAVLSLGLIVHQYERRWEEADLLYQRACELNPGNATAHHWYAVFLAEMGHFEQALTEIQAAVRLEPQSPAIISAVGWIWYLRGDYAAAIREFQRSVALGPKFQAGYVLLGMGYCQQPAHLQDAIAALQHAVELGPEPCDLPELGYAYALAGRHGEARQMLDRLVSCPGPPGPSPYGIATVYAALGDTNQAFVWLERAVKEKSLDALMLKFDPRLIWLRPDARFNDLVRRAGLSASLPGSARRQISMALVLLPCRFRATDHLSQESR